MSCSAKAAIAGAARVPVSVNGVVIAHDTISREAQNHPAPKPIDAWKAAARTLAVRELLLQEARRLGLRPAPLSDGEGRRETDEEALIRGLIEAEVATPDADAQSCRRYYEQNRARFRSADIFEASHILVAARRDDASAFAAARERVETLHAHLCGRPGAFEALATAHSDCPSGTTGGNLGQVASGATTPEFERALVRLEEGQISAPVETRYGFHIIRLERRIADAQLPFELVHAQIAAYLAERSQRLAIAQYVARLAARAQVSGVELARPDELRVH
jgi:peptidyl-prolyl cis-trans isomerase C